MAWLRVPLTEQQRAVVNAARDAHPDAHVRRKMLALRRLHGGRTRERAAAVTCRGRATVQRHAAAVAAGGRDGLRRWDVTGPVSDREAHREAIRQEFARRPARTIAEAARRIEGLTGTRRRPTQGRLFLKGLGLKFPRVRAVPVPPNDPPGAREGAGGVPGR
jgi:transposase